MESANTKNLKHLYDLSHAVPTVPSLGSVYTNKLYKTFHKKDLTIPNQINNGLKFCSSCETLMISGINMIMRVVYSRSSKNSKRKKEKVWKPRDRKLKYTCLTCNHSTFIELLKPEARPIVDGAKELSVEETKPSFVATWDPGKDKKKKTAKERAKKRKKNNLLNLLNSKKERDEQDKKKSSLLSLEEFMKG